MAYKQGYPDPLRRGRTLQGGIPPSNPKKQEPSVFMTEYRKRTKELTIRLTDQELDSIRSVALARGTSMSNLARDMLLSLGAEVRKTKSSKQNNKANDLDREFLAELGKIGGNINQLARFANTHKSRVDALALLSQLASIEKQLVSLIDDN
jgi:hypothetical protein